MFNEENILFFRNRRHDHVCLGHRIGAARRRVDKGHLSEDFICAKRLEHTVARTDLDLAAPDDKELARAVPFAENDPARG